MPSERDILQLLQTLRDRLDGDVSLEAMAATAGWSPFHFHRAFRKVVGETPKQYTQRLRLDRAAARLAAGSDPVLSIAAEAGFGSHEVFTRAFRRQFGTSPSAYRADALSGAAPVAKARHVALTDATAPCVGLYHIHPDPQPRRSQMPMLSIERRELTPAHVLIVRARCARHELSKTMGECFGKAFPYAMRIGAPLAGRPFTRYLTTGPGLFTIESGCVLAAAAQGEGDVEAATLPGGPAAVAMHGGSYDTLSETYAEMERWMETNSMRPGGAPWESYITDPADHPDPADWRTEICWPLGDR
jgi:AraC family transcriptional regulator